MRAFHIAPIAAALALAVAASPDAAAAQGARAAQADVRRADVASAPATRMLASYRLGGPVAPDFPSQLTVSDSAGTIVARYRAGRAAAELPMTVTVMYTDLVLQAETPSGVLTVVLERQNDTAAAELTGRWWLGEARGTLRARVAR
jgi:hypothetical protein